MVCVAQRRSKLAELSVAAKALMGHALGRYKSTSMHLKEPVFQVHPTSTKRNTNKFERSAFLGDSEAPDVFEWPTRTEEKQKHPWACKGYGQPVRLCRSRPTVLTKTRRSSPTVLS